MTLSVGSHVRLNVALASGVSENGCDSTLRGVITTPPNGDRRQIVTVRWDRHIRYPQSDEYTMLHYLDTLIEDFSPDSVQGRAMTYAARELSR